MFVLEVIKKLLSLECCFVLIKSKFQTGTVALITRSLLLIDTTFLNFEEGHFFPEVRKSCSVGEPKEYYSLLLLSSTPTYSFETIIILIFLFYYSRKFKFVWLRKKGKWYWSRYNDDDDNYGGRHLRRYWQNWKVCPLKKRVSWYNFNLLTIFRSMFEHNLNKTI